MLPKVLEFFCEYLFLHKVLHYTLQEKDFLLCNLFRLYIIMFVNQCKLKFAINLKLNMFELIGIKRLATSFAFSNLVDLIFCVVSFTLDPSCVSFEYYLVLALQ